MAKTRRKKKRTHVQSQAKSNDPKSFVFRRGKHSVHMKDLETDLRKVMQPNTAVNLRETRNNQLKDFVAVAGPLGVTHFLMLTATPHADYLRIAKTPRGPTLTMRIHSYSLMRDVVAAQQRPQIPSTLWHTAPLLVMNNFKGSKPLSLASALLQHLFPSINVNTVKLSSCQRVLLLHHHAETNTISLRHYAVHCRPTGVSKGVKALLMRRDPGDLSTMTDIAELVTKGGHGSESEGEEAQESRVQVPEGTQRLPGLAGKAVPRTTRVQLTEVGPRMELEVIKVEEGLADGKVLYHKYVSKSGSESAAQQAAHDDKVQLRAQRRRQQEDNVRRKLKERRLTERAKAEVASKEKGKRAQKGAKRAWWETEQGRVEEDDDAEYYRQEVGEEPGPEMQLGKRGGKPVPGRKPFQRSSKKARS